MDSRNGWIITTIITVIGLLLTNGVTYLISTNTYELEAKKVEFENSKLAYEQEMNVQKVLVEMSDIYDTMQIECEKVYELVYEMRENQNNIRQEVHDLAELKKINDTLYMIYNTLTKDAENVCDVEDMQKSLVELHSESISKVTRVKLDMKIRLSLIKHRYRNLKAVNKNT